ncbi:MAG: VanW family protein, partial [Clostridia bacterium]|nr:VanW family protein [Clostridia bacterium]
EMTDTRAYFPYKREPDLVSVPKAKLTIYEFVPWDSAQPGDLLYAYTTFYSTSMKKEGNGGRLYNIQLAADRLAGTVVPSGETFSYNAVCGPYTQENGYRSAPILSGESEMGYGGGVCQVCSTLYNIVLRIPTVIEEMHWHSQGGVSYLPAGFDATVGSQSDLIFRNILPYDVRIEFENLDGVMTAFFFRN